MFAYVITRDGHSEPIIAREYQGFLVEAGTTMPLIDEEKLCLHPHRELFQSLIDKARPAAQDIGDLVSETRLDHRDRHFVEEGMSKEVKTSLRAQRNRDYRQQFAQLKYKSSEAYPEGAKKAIYALWQNPEIQDVLIAAPKKGMLIDKLAAKDFNFTPDDVQQILNEDNGLAVLEKVGGVGVVEAVMLADIDGKKIKADGNSPFVRKFLTYLKDGQYEDALAYLDSDKTPPAEHILSYGNYYAIKQAFQSNYQVGCALLDYLPARKQNSIIASVSLDVLRLAIKEGNLPMFEQGVQGIGKYQVHNIPPLFKLACEYGCKPIVDYCLQQTAPRHRGHPPLLLDKLTRKKMIKEGFFAACDTGQGGVAALLRPLVGGKHNKRVPVKRREADQGIEDVEERLSRSIEIKIPALQYHGFPYPLTPLLLSHVVPDGHPEFKSDVYDALIPWMMIGCNHYHLGHPEKRAYAMATIFASAEDAQAYMHEVFNRHAGNGEADAFDKATKLYLPQSLNWDVAAWRQFMDKYGEKAAKFLSFAPQIEEQFALHNQKMMQEDDVSWEFSKSTLSSLVQWQQQVNVLNVPDLATMVDVPEIERFCTKWGVSKTLGDQCKHSFLTLQHRRDRGELISDYIPDIGVIDGKDLGDSHYYMVKLPKDDLRGLVIPHFISSVCTGPDSTLARSHMLNPNVGLYVILKKKEGRIDPENDKIVAKVSVLRAITKGHEGGSNALAFNAWERNHEANKLCMPFLKEAAVRAMKANPAIEAVHLGHTQTGHNEREWADFPKTTEHVFVLDGVVSMYDLRTAQFVVATREKDLSLGANIVYHGKIHHAPSQSVSL